MYGQMDQAHYDTLFAKLMQKHSGDPYLTMHKARYGELFDHLAHFTANKEKPRVAEIGLSAFSRLYKQLFPHIEFITIDRSLELGGVEEHFAVKECQAAAHYNIDLNEQAVSPVYGQPLLGQFDLVLFCEVLEHLRVDAIQLFEELLSLLKPDGFLLVTTPNFFSLNRLRQITNRENPQEMFPRRHQDHEAACHFREFTLQELASTTESAGGKVIKAAFSDVWYGESTNQIYQTHPELRSNLLLVAARKECAYDNRLEPRHDLATMAQTTESSPYKSASAQALQNEIATLKAIIHGYENGRIIRFLKWLRKYGLLHG